VSPVTARKALASFQRFCHFFSMAVKSYFNLDHTFFLGFVVYAGAELARSLHGNADYSAEASLASSSALRKISSLGTASPTL
jgi:hypothetical protein